MSTAGKYLQCRLGGSGIGTNGNPPGVRIKGAQNWRVRTTGDNLDATDSETEGFTNTDVGAIGATVNISLVVSTLEVVFPGFDVNDILADLLLYSSGFHTVADYDFPYAIVTEAGLAVEVRGQVKQDITIMNKGRFAGPRSTPTGTAPFRLLRPVVSPDA